LGRISFKTICGIAGIPAAIIVTMLFGGNSLQVMLAPVGGVAVGMGVGIWMLQMEKLLPTATWGEYKRAVANAKSS
jgi:hypothetical protein